MLCHFTSLIHTLCFSRMHHTTPSTAAFKPRLQNVRLLQNLAEDHAKLNKALVTAVHTCELHASADAQKIGRLQMTSLHHAGDCVRHCMWNTNCEPTLQSQEDESKQRLAAFKTMSPHDQNTAYAQLEEKFIQIANESISYRDATDKTLFDASIENSRLQLVLARCQCQESGNRRPVFEHRHNIGGDDDSDCAASCATRSKSSRHHLQFELNNRFIFLGSRYASRGCIHKYDNHTTLTACVRGNTWGNYKCTVCREMFHSPLHNVLGSRNAVKLSP